MACVIPISDIITKIIRLCLFFWKGHCPSNESNIRLILYNRDWKISFDVSIFNTVWTTALLVLPLTIFSLIKNSLRKRERKRYTELREITDIYMTDCSTRMIKGLDDQTLILERYMFMIDFVLMHLIVVLYLVIRTSTISEYYKFNARHE